MYQLNEPTGHHKHDLIVLDKDEVKINEEISPITQFPSVIPSGYAICILSLKTINAQGWKHISAYLDSVQKAQIIPPEQLGFLKDTGGKDVFYYQAKLVVSGKIEDPVALNKELYNINTKIPTQKLKLLSSVLLTGGGIVEKAIKKLSYIYPMLIISSGKLAIPNIKDLDLIGLPSDYSFFKNQIDTELLFKGTPSAIAYVKGMLPLS